MTDTREGVQRGWATGSGEQGGQPGVRGPGVRAASGSAWAGGGRVVQCGMARPRGCGPGKGLPKPAGELGPAVGEASRGSLGLPGFTSSWL